MSRAVLSLWILALLGACDRGGGPDLTREEVIALATAAAEAQKINLSQYTRPEASYKIRDDSWFVSYECNMSAPPPGCHLDVRIEDSTRSATVFPGE